MVFPLCRWGLECKRLRRTKRLDGMGKVQEKNQRSLGQVLVVITITIICLAPFLGKAYHIDDTHFLWIAKHIQTHPLDFYGFVANWYGHKIPMSSINFNPPLVYYYMALVALLFGWSEIVFHLAFLVPAVAFALGTYYVARAMCPRPHLAALIAVISPAFLVSSTNVMVDTTMAAFYVWAIAFWLRGLEEHKSLHLFLAAIAISCATLSKYFGMTLVPLLLFYSLMVRRKFGSWLFFLAIPVLILIGYQGLSYVLYGHNLLSTAASAAVTGVPLGGSALLTKTLTGLAFTGGCFAAAVFYAPLLWSRRSWGVGGALLVLILTALLGMGTLGNLSLRNANGIRWGLLLQSGLFIVAGIHILALAVNDLVTSKSASSWLLFLWILGTFLFSSFFNWTINARTIFPMAPAVGILVMRRYDQMVKAAQFHLSWRPILPLIPAACVALTVTWADYTFANSQRSAARMFQEESRNYPHTLWFQGHWGFQYYMEAFGAKAVDFDNTVMKQGDILVVPMNNSKIKFPQGDQFHLVGKRQLLPCRWLGTMQFSLGAGFYTDQWGPLPFAFGAAKPEEYYLILVGDFDNSREVVDQFREALFIRPNYAFAYKQLEKALVAREQTDMLIAKIQESLKLAPENPSLHLQLGNLYRSKGKFEKARHHFTKALELDPDCAPCHNNLGGIFEGQGKIKEALFHYSMSLKLNPNFAEAHFNLGNVFARQGKDEEAITHFSRALHLNPDFAEAHNSLGVVLARQNNLDKAIVHFSTALRLKPNFGLARANLQLALQQAGKTESPLITGARP